MIIDVSQFAHWLRAGRPLMDVRAPVEFAKGSLPQARNIPLLDDQQRHLIGLQYAEQGEDAAIALGLKLATPTERHTRLTAWRNFIQQHPEGALFCFRGGLRSNTTQQWLAAEGLHYPLIEGGYKALRKFLLEQFESYIEQAPLRVLAGPTGSGKTDVIQQWPQSIDLEGIAHHRGSVFGDTAHPQPTQIDWEHAVIVQWLRRQSVCAAPVLIEDESRLIGRIFVPEPLQKRLRSSPQVRLVCSRQERLERLRREFVYPLLERFTTADPEHGWRQLEQALSESLQRIQKRLGGVLHTQLRQLIPQALLSVRQYQDYAGFDTFIGVLLEQYYDPMYDYQMTQHARSSLFTGNAREVGEWLLTQDGPKAKGLFHASP